MAARLQSGDAAAVEAWIAAQGEHAERLRRLLPTVLVMADLGSAADGSAPPAGLGGEPVPGVLDDFRISRPVGVKRVFRGIAGNDDERQGFPRHPGGAYRAGSCAGALPALFIQSWCGSTGSLA
jgi:hypothetical protein